MTGKKPNITRFKGTLVSASLPLLFIAVFTIAGCATGPGINRHELFVTTTHEPLPFKVIVDEETLAMESGPVMLRSKEDFTTALVTGGVISAAMGGNQTMVDGIRGKFSVGEVFGGSARAFSGPVRDKEAGTLRLGLVRFQQYLPLGKAEMETIMEFSSTLEEAGETTFSAYSCHWKGKDLLVPQREKSMLREIVEHTMSHWGGLFLAHTDSGGADFPEESKDSFSGNDIECLYEVFVPRSSARASR